MENRIDLKKEILDRFVPAIKCFEDKDIYAISFFVYDENDNPCLPTVTLGYNTDSHIKECRKMAKPRELKWNYAYWLQNQECIFGLDDTAELTKQWIIENGLTYDPDYFPYSVDVNEETAQGMEEITKKYVEVLISAVKELHQSGVLFEKFGKEIPVLIHELEYYDEIAIQNIEANGRELLDDFVAFCGYE